MRELGVKKIKHVHHTVLMYIVQSRYILSIVVMKTTVRFDSWTPRPCRRKECLWITGENKDKRSVDQVVGLALP